MSHRGRSLGAALAGCTVYLLLASGLLLVGHEDTPFTWTDGAGGLFLALKRLGCPVEVIEEGDKASREATVLVVSPEGRLEPWAAGQLVEAVERGAWLVVAAAENRAFQLLPEPLRPGGPIPAVVSLTERRAVLMPTLPFRPSSSGPVTLGPPGRLRVFAASKSSWPPATETLILHAGPASRSIAVAWPVGPGGGRVILCSEPALFTIEWLATGANLEAGLSLLVSRSGVQFDRRWKAEAGMLSELAGNRSLVKALYGTRPGAAAALAVLGLFLALYLHGLRPGGPEPPARRPRGTASYVDGVAELTRARASPAALLQPYREKVLQEASRRLGVGRNDLSLLIPLLARHTGRDREEVSRLLRKVPVRAAEAPRIARALDVLREEIR